MTIRESKCLTLIHNMFQSLTKTERKVAEYIIANPAEVVHMTITDLAEVVGSAEATISRLCKKLNFPRFQSLKIALASDLYEPFESVINEVDPEDPIDVVAGKVFQTIIEALQDTLKILNAEALDQAITAILTARRIEVYGTGGSSVMAHDVEHRFSRFGIPVKANSDQDEQVISASLLAPGDVVIAISHTGSNRGVLESVRVAKESGATIIVITSHIRSPLSKIADILLNGMAREINHRSEAMSSRLIHLALVDVLYVGAMLRQPARITNNMQRIRQAIAKRRV
ncbi:MAG: MurR/RpiR family transcriptional regulator [Negativicutes bacterium]|nr:MurR/RpiR family transcriptional regulator [Negativicutes bacterium]